MKKICCLIIAFVFCFGAFSGCSPNDNTSAGDGKYYTVTFDLNGASGYKPGNQEVKSANFVEQPTNSPIRQGYAFGGWAKDASGAELWNFTKDKVYTNITLYAVWKIEDLSAKQEYENNIATWSQPNHLYFHYKRFADTETDYNDWSMWIWQYAPKDSEGRTVKWFKYDESGAVADLDLTKTYNDGGRTGDYTIDYLNTTTMGFLVVHEASKTSTGHWKSDGGNIYITKFDTLARDGGGTHIFISESNVGSYKTKYTETVQVTDPYDGVEKGTAISKNNLDSSVTKYPKVSVSQDFYNNVGVGYQIQVSTFADGDGDGFGDLRGIINNLDYLKELNVNVLWLTPVQLSNAYHGYDIIDFYKIDPRFGTESDYRELIYKAHKLGIRIVMDLVVNHTAVNNVWFEKSAKLVKETDKNGNEIDYRNFYNWITPETREQNGDKAAWYEYSTYGYYYYGKFNSSQPELNYDYQGTRDAIVDVALYWLGLGLDGFRIDALKHVYMVNEYQSKNGANDVIDVEHGKVVQNEYSRNATKNNNFFREFSYRIKAAYPDAFLVGENWDGNVQRISSYYQGVDSQFNFGLYYNAGRDFSATYAGGEYKTGLDLYNQNVGTGKAIDSPFTSNHDVSRALNTVMGGSGNIASEVTAAQSADAIDKAKVWASIVLTLPGVSWVYYGDEIGMSGYNNKDDNAPPHSDRWVRQPFKWADDAKADGMTGFSFEKYDIEWDTYNKNTLKSVPTQKDDPNSMLNHYKSLTALKSTDPVLIYGEYEYFDAYKNYGGGNIYAFNRKLNDTTYYVFHNLSGNEQSFSFGNGTEKVFATSGAGHSGGNITIPAYGSYIGK